MNRAQVTGVPIIGGVNHRPDERRRSSRYRCCGRAEVVRIPATGVAVQATVSDLSLHGCRILADLSFEFGVPLELRLLVKSISFRASGKVKVVRGPAEIGIEFTQMSTGGQRRLAELLADLERVSSRLGRNRRVPHVIEGEWRPQSADTAPATNALVCDVDNALTLPMLSRDADRAPQSQLVPYERFLLVQPPEVDVFF